MQINADKKDVFLSKPLCSSDMHVHKQFSILEAKWKQVSL